MNPLFDYIQYNFAMLKVPFSDRKFIPKMPGIYVLFGKSSLYCGGTQNLHRRVQDSKLSQGFGDTLFFFPIDPFGASKGRSIDKQIKSLEQACISALHTIIWGHGLPLTLTNQMHVLVLPKSAWPADISDELAFGISIAQTVLYSVGLPRCLVELPFLPLAMSGFSAKLAAENTPLWPSIYATEREARKNPNHPRGPMFVVHPAPR